VAQGGPRGALGVGGQGILASLPTRGGAAAAAAPAPGVCDDALTPPVHVL
jgi:hypothetical protein